MCRCLDIVRNDDPTFPAPRTLGSRCSFTTWAVDEECFADAEPLAGGDSIWQTLCELLMGFGGVSLDS
jgi:hypothetical protein